MLKKKISRAEQERIAKNAGVPVAQGVAHLNGGKKIPAKRSLLVLAIAAALSACGAGMNDAQAQAMTLAANGIEIKTCAHDAGAQCSLTLRGKQYVDDFDHGRQWQSAIVYDGKGEALNPTEAGGAYDGPTPNPSSSVFENGKVIGGTLLTSGIRMGYWYPVGGERLSDNKVSKYVKIGLPGLPNVISYQIVFTRPAEEKHSFGQYEVLTGYMPPDFSKFYTLDVRNGARYVQELEDGPGEQNKPVILCTADHQHCAGAYSPTLPQPAYINEAGYGRWRFKGERVVKWNMVYRFPNPAAYQAFQVYAIVGTLDEVTLQMRELHRQVGQ